MAKENGERILYGLAEDAPGRIKTAEELIDFVDRAGFLPLFKNQVPSFSVEEYTVSAGWWSGDPERDPWEWRKAAARSGRVAYGKFFNKKAGYISKKWLPVFVNYRRCGYDFDSLYEEGKADRRGKKIMDLIEKHSSLASFEIKQMANFCKGGEKNFDGVITELQMRTYLCIADFRRKINRRGEEYGWPTAVYTPPEEIFGYEWVTSEYGRDPAECREQIAAQIADFCPGAVEKQILREIGMPLL